MKTDSILAIVIDDMVASRALMIELLRKLDIQNVREADSGDRGLNLIRDLIKSGEKPNMVFLDWHMPGMTGMEVLKKLKSDPSTRDVPVIMVSAEEQSASILEAIEEGAANYIVKPITEQLLAEKLSRLIQK
jgi:two-component system, chemotaxis family, chemotaxis protein CheY